MTTVTTRAGLTGMDLRLRRTAAMVNITELAREVGVTRTSISNVERLARPTPEYVERYLDALDRIRRA